MTKDNDNCITYGGKKVEKRKKKGSIVEQIKIEIASRLIKRINFFLSITVMELNIK